MLGLIFLKYISDKFNARYQELVDEDEGFEEDRDEYTYKNILPKNFARQELDKRRLGEVVDLFTNVQMAQKGDTRDILGRTYEYRPPNSPKLRAKMPESSTRRPALCAH